MSCSTVRWASDRRFQPPGRIRTLQLDWFLVMLVVVVVASILMGILVIHAYLQA